MKKDIHKKKKGVRKCVQAETDITTMFMNSCTRCRICSLTRVAQQIRVYEDSDLISIRNMTTMEMAEEISDQTFNR